MGKLCLLLPQPPKHEAQLGPDVVVGRAGSARAVPDSKPGSPALRAGVLQGQPGQRTQGSVCSCALPRLLLYLGTLLLPPRWAWGWG